MEDDGLGLDLSVLDVNLVADEDDWDVFADAHQIPVPVGDVLVGDPGGDVEHHDGALALDVVAVTETAELLLTGGVPNIEPDWSSVGVEHEGMDFDAEGGDVLLLELAGQVPLHEGRLSGAAVADENQLKGRHVLLCFGHDERFNLQREG